MIKIIQKKWKWFGYALYGVLLTAGLLYYRFPSDTLRVYLESTLAKTNPRILFSVRDLRPGLPLSLDLIDAKISLKGTPRKPLLSAKNVSVRPEAWSFLLGTPKYHFDVHAYDGNIKGYVQFESRQMTAPFTTSLRFKGIHLDRYPYLSSFIGRDVSGVMGGNIVYAGQYDKFVGGAGEATLSISDGSVQLLQPILGLESLQFDQLSIKIALKNRTVDLSSVGLEGRTVKAGLSGTITPKKDFSTSSLDLRGTIEPQATTFLGHSLKNLKRSFIVRGTFRNPEFKLL
jgi:type II secretion system protein N